MGPDEDKPAGPAGEEPALPAPGDQSAAIALAACGALALAISLRFFYASWSGQRHFTSWLTGALYCLVPAAGAALLFTSTRLKPMARIRLLLLIASLTVSVYATELLLISFQGSRIKAFALLDGHPQLQPAMTSLGTSTDRKQYAANLTRQFGAQIDIRTSRETLDDLRRKDIDANPILTPSNHLFLPQPDGSIRSAIAIDGREVLPLGGVSGRVTLLCNESGQWIDYRSDRRGFRNPDDIWNLTSLDIASVGDSFTHGYCVQDDKHFVALIRGRYPATMNLGMAGDGPLLMLATLTELARPFSPKLVLWFYYEGNDLVDLQTERKSALLERYLTSGFSQPDLVRQGEIDGAMLAEIPRLKAIEEENERRRARNSMVSSVTSFVKVASLRERLGLIGTDPMALRAADDFETDNLAAFRDVLRQARSRVEGWNGQLYFVYLPEWTRYTRYSSWGKTKRDSVLALVRTLGIPIIDVAPVFEAHGDPLSLFPFRFVGHYAETGHRLVADEVLRQIASNGRLRPQ